MKQKEQKKILSFEICSVANIALGTGICLALLYVMTYLHWYDAMGEKISTTFWIYWLKLVGIYIIIQIVVGHYENFNIWTDVKDVFISDDQYENEN